MNMYIYDGRTLELTHGHTRPQSAIIFGEALEKIWNSFAWRHMLTTTKTSLRIQMQATADSADMAMARQHTSSQFCSPRELAATHRRNDLCNRMYSYM